MWYVLQLTETLHIDYPQKLGINVWVTDRLTACKEPEPDRRRAEKDPERLLVNFFLYKLRPASVLFLSGAPEWYQA